MSEIIEVPQEERQRWACSRCYDELHVRVDVTCLLVTLRSDMRPDYTGLCADHAQVYAEMSKGVAQ